jgi:DNA helicase-2/ATP-dependent DNA helicase PcrA
MFDRAAWDLNDGQRAAVEHGDGPLLVLAGAGTGKTSTLASRVGRLLARGGAPERICLLTFSRRAAQEMLTRAGHLADPRSAGRVWGGTFHAVGHRLLRRYGSRVGLDAGFTVLDEGDAAELLSFVRHELGHSSAKGRRFPRAETLVKIYSRLVNAQQPLSEVLEASFPWCATEVAGIREVIKAYTARKRGQRVLDFDDLLLCWRALGQDAGASLLGGLFDHVLVDEYQDTNSLQADVVELLAPTGQGLTVVGDDAQAIYSFRAATPRNILEFPERFPGTTIVRLEENYRSTPQVLAVANAVMAEATVGYPKTLWSSRPAGCRPLLRRTLDDAAQAAAVCDAVLRHREAGVRLQDQAVLFRAIHHSDVLEVELRRRNVPFVKYGGLRFLEAAHVKDLLATLRILENPYDELAWFRVLQLVDGVGPARATSLVDALGVRRELGRPGTASPLAGFLQAEPSLPSASREQMTSLRESLGQCVKLEHQGPGVDVERLRTFLDPTVTRRYEQPGPRLADLDALQRVASGYPSRARLLADLTLDPPSSTSDLAGPGSKDEDWLVLSTVHSAKGGEWRVVHLIHASDGLFPSDLATGQRETLEEERRLFYVALTRARDALEINATQRYYYQRSAYRDPHGYGQLSRFVSGPVQALLDHEHLDTPGPDDQPQGGSTLGHVDALVSALLS